VKIIVNLTQIFLFQSQDTRDEEDVSRFNWTNEAERVQQVTAEADDNDLRRWNQFKPLSHKISPNDT
jgi:hypothetical protein